MTAMMPEDQPFGATGDAARTAQKLYRQVVMRSAAPTEEEERRLGTLAWRAKLGDREARDELYITLHDWLMMLAGRALRTARGGPAVRVTPEDVRQEIFLGYCDLLRDWRPERGSFRAYLSSALPGRLRHYVRGQIRPREISATTSLARRAGSADDPQVATGWDALLAPAADAADEYLEGEIRALLLGALDPLSRRVVELHILAGWPMREVAATLGIHLQRAWRLHSGALATLRLQIMRLRAAGLL